MFVYEKKLQYPVKIKNTNPRLASLIISQYGGPDGELGASLRYLSQRYSLPYPELKGLLTDIGTEAVSYTHLQSHAAVFLHNGHGGLHHLLHGKQLGSGHTAGKGDDVGLRGQLQQLADLGTLQQIHSARKLYHECFPPQILLIPQMHISFHFVHG